MTTGGATLTYDAENRLVQTSGTLDALLYYDPLAAEYAGSYGARTQLYLHAPGRGPPAAVASGRTIDDGQMRSLQADCQGSIIAASDASGNPLAKTRRETAPDR